MSKPLAPPAPLERQFLQGIQFALEELSRDPVERVTQLVHDQVTSGRGSAAKSRQPLTDAVAEQILAILEQELLARLLSSETSARQHRAVLAEVQASVGTGATPFPFRSSIAPFATTNAEEITSEAASKLLHVSRTHLNAIADAGVLGPVRRTEGGNRRLMKSEVMHYFEASQDRQLKGFQDMRQATAELGLYEDEEKALKPKRSKRP